MEVFAGTVQKLRTAMQGCTKNVFDIVGEIFYAKLSKTFAVSVSVRVRLRERPLFLKHF